MQLEFFIPATNGMDALELESFLPVQEEVETDGVAETAAAILAALRALPVADVELCGLVVDDHTAVIPPGPLEGRVEEVARLWLYLNELSGYDEVQKGGALAFASEDWSYFDFEELLDNRHYITDAVRFSFPEGDYDELGRSYVDEYVSLANVDSIVTDNIDFEGIGQDVAACYAEYSWAGTSFLLDL